MNKVEVAEFTFEAESLISLNSKTSDSLDDQDDIVTADSAAREAEALNYSEISVAEPSLPPVLRKLSFEPDASEIEIARNEL